jgi:cell division transport system permease protein
MPPAPEGGTVLRAPRGRGLWGRRVYARGVPYFIREGVDGIRRNALMSMAAMTVTAVTLVALGVALVVAQTLDRIARGVEQKTQVSVYLREGLNADDLDALRARLSVIPGVAALTFVSKDQALAGFQESMGGKVNLRDLLSHNPLPASFVLTADGPDDLQAITAAASALPEVEHATYGADAVDRLLAATRAVRWGGVALSVGLALVAMIIVVTTIRLTVYARRTEIEVMRLVGGTAWFIRWPFVVEGALTGAASAGLALLVVVGGYSWLAWGMHAAFPLVPLLRPGEVALMLVWKLMLWGISIGVGGSLLAVRRYLFL